MAGRRATLEFACRADALSPLAVLGRGFSMTTREDNSKLIRFADDVASGDRIRTRLANGQIVSIVTKME